MTQNSINIARYFELVKEEKAYLGQSGYSRRYLEKFAKEKREAYQELLHYDTLLRSEIYFRQKQDYVDLIQNYLETKRDFHELACRIRALQKREETEKEWFDKYVQEKKIPTLITDSRAEKFYELLSELFSRVFHTAKPDLTLSKKPREVNEDQLRKVIQMQEIFFKIQDLLHSEGVKQMQIDIREYITLYHKLYHKENSQQILSQDERESYEEFRIRVWSEFYFRQKQDYFDLLEPYLANQLDLPTLKILFLKVDQRDTCAKANFEQEISSRGLTTLTLDRRAFRFYELLSELCESMIFDKVEGEEFSREFQPAHPDSFFTKQPREVTEKEFRDELQKIVLKMRYLLKPD